MFSTIYKMVNSSAGVLKKARTSPAFAQQLDCSKRPTMALDAAKL